MLLTDCGEGNELQTFKTSWLGMLKACFSLGSKFGLEERWHGETVVNLGIRGWDLRMRESREGGNRVWKSRAKWKGMYL